MAIALLVLLVIVAPIVDSRELKDDVLDLQNDLKTVKSRLALLEQQAYFKATFNSGTPKVEPGAVVFDKVLENIGNGYSSANGVFTAGIKGLYFFLVQSFTNGAGDANWDLTVNGQMVLRAESTTQGSTSNEYVYPVALKVGDKVSVSSRSSIDVWGINHSFFAGYLARAIP